MVKILNRSLGRNENGNETMITSQHNRPVFLDLLRIRLPVAGVLSIGHRISGVLLALSIPLMIYLLDTSVSGPEGFERVRAVLSGWPFAVFLFLFLWALLHHLLAGLRYLLLDVHIGLSRPWFRRTAWVVLVAAPVLALLLTGGLR
jgi:succinate dehydrogenase / fumarate reductase cytochrome b subunit